MPQCSVSFFQDNYILLLPTLKRPKDSTLFHYTERQIPDWTARTCRSHGKDDNLVGTFLYRLADIAEICTEQTKSSPQKHHLHSSATLHSSTALCWFVPGTHVSSPQFRTSLPTATISLSLQSLCPSPNLCTFPAFSTEMIEPKKCTKK